MKIVYKKPWFWVIINLFYPNAKWGEVGLALGDTLYHHKEFTKAQLAHEEVHLRQHHYSKFIGVLMMIRAYFDKKFLLNMETEAYQVQHALEPNAKLYATYLSSPVYGNIITYNEALKLFS